LDSLDADTRSKLIQIADEVTVAANNSVKDKEEANRKNILDAGGKINELTPAQRKQWVDAMKPVWKQFEDEIGADVIAAAAAS
jgi:C4-dicarboxylate-binding protein DctP